MNKKILLTSALTIVLCAALICGSTLAMFTYETDANVAITAAQVQVIATVNPVVKTWSIGQTEETSNTFNSFPNGGTATVESDGTLQVRRMTPGDSLSFNIEVTNNSNINIKYKVSATSAKMNGKDVDLSDALVCTATVGNTDYVLNKTQDSWETDWITVNSYDLGNGNAVGGTIETVKVTVVFPNGTPEEDNVYRGNSGTDIAFTIIAVQGNDTP